MKVSIIGTGYVGLVTGVCFADMGHEVTCVDVDTERVDNINKGIPPIYEDNMEAMLKRSVETGKLVATTDLVNAIISTDVSFICVGTPPGVLDYIDLRYVDQVAVDIGNILREKKDFHIVVVKSTVMPGTTVHSVLPILEKNSGKTAGEGFGLAMNPEFLREGQAVYDFMNPDRIVLGVIDERSREVLRTLYRDFDCPLFETDPKTAEMVKYTANSYLATKISFINDIGNLCKLLGIDVYEVSRGIGMDKRISPHFLNAGIGFGGSCFPKDLKALVGKAKEVYYRPAILNAAIELNETQPLRLVELLEARVGSLKGVHVAVLGLAFKPGTDDMREAPSIKIIHTLLKKGAVVHGTDPQAVKEAKETIGKEKGIFLYERAEDAVAKADNILIVTEWDQFRNEDLYRGKVVIDGRRVEEAQVAEYYEGVCW